jgi:crotonobetainyl-CoA:carnitine CoA-transferase CaiB-like acyl-CoA transferase
MSGPLRNVRVLDASSILAGPLLCQFLGDFGADVIKVEHPVQGDGLRGHGPRKDETPLWWKEVGRNKRCVGIDLSRPDGAATLLELVRHTDILVENFRPGCFERWGLTWEALSEANPGLIYVRVTGFGQDGPYAQRRAFGTLAEAMSGFAAMTGEADGPPTLPPFGLADTIAGLVAMNGALLALREREVNGGLGQIVDVSILESMLLVLGPALAAYDQLGVVATRTGNRTGNNAPRNLYRAKDGKWLAVSTSATPIARRVLELVGHPEVIDEEWFATGHGRAQHVDLLDGYVAQWMEQRTAPEVQEAFEAVGAAVAPVYDVSDIMADPQVRFREMVTAVADTDLGSVAMRNVMPRLTASPGAIRFTGRELGADTDEVLRELAGLGPERLGELRSSGVIA